MGRFDVVVLTAANEVQARGYREQLAWRRACGLLGAETAALVVADPGARRAGSFCATLNVMRALFGPQGPALPRRAGRFPKALVCHSGGDSRRTPAYAAQGKAFTPVPCRGPGGQPLALFDLILRNAEALPIEAGTLVAAGDVVLTFGGEDLARMDFSRPGVTGVGSFGSAERGSRHGVYVCPAGANGADTGSRLFPVRGFLQKPDAAAMRLAGAMNGRGEVAVDTGLLALDPATCRTLAGIATDGLLADVEAGRCPAMDVYEEFAAALVPAVSEEAYLARFEGRPGCDGAHAARLRGLHRALRGTPFQANLATACDFFHIGSSRELLGGFSDGGPTARLYGFAAGRRRDAAVGGADAFVFNSPACQVAAAGRALVEGVGFQGLLKLGGDNVVTGLPACAAASIALPRGVGLVVMPVGDDGWAAVAYGVLDDFKTPFRRDGGAERPCLFLNGPVGDWLGARGVAPEALWRGDEAAGMWSARLWRTGALDDVVEEAVDFAGGEIAPRRSPARPVGSGLGGASRQSLSELVPQVRQDRLLRR